MIKDVVTYEDDEADKPLKEAVLPFSPKHIPKPSCTPC